MAPGGVALVTGCHHVFCSKCAEDVTAKASCHVCEMGLTRKNVVQHQWGMSLNQVGLLGGCGTP